MALAEPNDPLGLWARIRRLNPAVEWPDSDETLTAALAAGWRGGATGTETVRDFDTRPVLDNWADAAGGTFHDRTTQLAGRADAVATGMHALAAHADVLTTETADAKAMIAGGVYGNLPAYAMTYLLPAAIGEPTRDAFAGTLADGMDVRLAAAESRILAAAPPPPPDSPEAFFNGLQWLWEASADEIYQDAHPGADPFDNLSRADKQHLIEVLTSDSNEDFPLPRENAVAALRGGPPGTTPEVAGPGEAVPDVQFRDADGNVVLARELKNTSGTFNSFNTELTHATRQLNYRGEVWFQVPEGTNGEQWVRNWQNFRSDAGLEKYRDVNVVVRTDTGAEIGRYNLGERLPR